MILVDGVRAVSNAPPDKGGSSGAASDRKTVLAKAVKTAATLAKKNNKIPFPGFMPGRSDKDKALLKKMTSKDHTAAADSLLEEAKAHAKVARLLIHKPGKEDLTQQELAQIRDAESQAEAARDVAKLHRRAAKDKE